MSQGFWTAVGALAAVASATVSLYAIWPPKIVAPPDSCQPGIAAECIESSKVDASKAFAACQKYMLCSPNNPSAHIQFGKTALASGKFDEAKKEFDTALQIGERNNDKSTVATSCYNIAQVFLA